MSRNAIKITENLMLRRIDPVTMYCKYMAGDFKHCKIPDNDVKISTAFVNLSKKLGSDQSSESYRFNDKTNTGQVIVTTNHPQYQYKKDIGNGDIRERPKAFCRWCHRKISGTPIGVPIYMEINERTKETVFGIEDTHDTFGCALATIKRYYSCKAQYKDPLYMDAQQLLHCMYYKMHPDKLGERIVEAKDWRLLHSNNGPLSDEEYDNERYEYLNVANVVLTPVKRQYIKLSIK